jgi:ComF family protein
MARALCTFSGSIKTAIHAFKYQNKTNLAKTLIGLMKRSTLPLRIDQYDKLVPVPLHKNRLRQRGYNQSLLLAREISKRYRVPMGERILTRIRDSIPQVQLVGAKRERNVKGVFAREGDVVGMKILLVDDVFTTGATVNECARVLLKGGAKRIDVFTVARAV